MPEEVGTEDKSGRFAKQDTLFNSIFLDPMGIHSGLWFMAIDGPRASRSISPMWMLK